MKLIDLLLQELPKRGGWPGSKYVGEVMALDGVSWSYKEGCYPTAYSDGFRVIRSEYEAALAASQQPAWNGEGVPPVGSLCRYRAFSDMPWVECEVLGWHENEVWLKRTEDGKTFTMGNPELFPVLTEDDMKREQVIDGMVQFYIYYHGYPKGAEQHLKVAAALYDAIADGKIPHITLK